MNSLIGTHLVSLQIFFGEVVQDPGKTFQNVSLVYIFSGMSHFNWITLPKDLEEILVIFLIAESWKLSF